MLTHILLFGKASLDKKQRPSYLMQLRIIPYRRTDLKVLVFCNFLLHVHLFNSFPYPNLFFFENIHSYFIWFLGFLLLFINININITFFYKSLFIYTQMSLEYLRHQMIVIFFTICLIFIYMRCPYKRNSKHFFIYVKEKLFCLNNWVFPFVNTRGLISCSNVAKIFHAV